MPYLDVKIDFAFKKVFGSENSSAVLIDFLNAVLEYPPDQAITELTIINPYQSGINDTYIDVKAAQFDGRQLLIKIQMLNLPGFEQQILYDTAHAYTCQAQTSDEYSLINAIITLTLTDLQLFASPQLKSCFKLIEKQQLLEYSDDIELIFIELPKFNLPENDLQTAKDRWLYFLKNAGALPAIPDTLAQEPAIRQAFEIANLDGLSAVERKIQSKRYDFIQQQRGCTQQTLDDGRMEGWQTGMSQGMAQGKRLMTFTIARQLLDILDDATISEKTGLSEAEVAKLRDSYIQPS